MECELLAVKEALTEAVTEEEALLDCPEEALAFEEALGS
jgi:hypothetical protein